MVFFRKTQVTCSISVDIYDDNDDTINSSKKAFIPADKSRNYYEMDMESHNKLYTENITKTYKKLDETIYTKINHETKLFAEKLGISEKVKCLAKSNAFITIKDHKEDFLNNPKCRPINPAKPELGKVSKAIIDTINKIVRIKTKVNQWHNTREVIEWFESIKNKKVCSFTQFDIEEFYPSISKKLLESSLVHASQFIDIPEDHQAIIMHSRKSLLFTNNEQWVKKNDDPNFDVSIGSYDGAELCELVGSYILYHLGKKYGIQTNGLYRDDGLCCFKNTSGPESERIKKNIIKMFKEKFDLRITILPNLKTVNFLDFTLNLNTGTYQPYNKPNNQPI